MKQVFQTNIGIKVLDVPIPTPSENELLIKVRNSLISTGTESGSLKPKNVRQKVNAAQEKFNKVLKMLKDGGVKNTFEKVYSKVKHIDEATSFAPLGYSNSGEVIAKGRNVTGFNVGDRVVCGGNTYAVHGEYAAVPKNLVVKLSPEVSFRDGAFTTIGSIAMQGIRRAEIQAGETIVIFGLGLLGLLAVQIAAAWGYRVVGLDIDDHRIKLAKQLGADFIFNTRTTPEYIKAIEDLTMGYGADASVIYASTQSSEPVNSSFKFCRSKANVVIVGSVGMDLDRADFYKKEQNLLISTSYGPGRYDPDYEEGGHDYPIGYVRWTENRNMQAFVQLLEKKKVKLDPLIGKKEKVDDALTVYKTLAAHDSNMLTVLFEYDADSDIKENLQTKIENNEIRTILAKDSLRVGVIGAGGYIASYILPIIKSLFSDFNLLSVSNKTSASTLSVVNKFGFKNGYSNYHELLDDDRIDLVVIGTRHNMHAPIVLDALKENKHVFVEKPLALTSDELNAIRDAMNNTNGRVFVGFNRRYSRLTQELRKELGEAPVLITYRINAGHIPKSHWVQDPLIGGGRLIGEVCHFLDYCNYLLNELPVSYSIDHIAVDNTNIQNEDNVVITLKYGNGSIATIIYTSIGGKKQPKEHIEVFQNGKTFVIEDFIRFIRYDHQNISEEVLKEQDKGRTRQMKEIARCLKGKDSLIPSFNFDFFASELAISLQESINGQS